MQRWLDFLRTDDLPLLTRRNYRYEFQHMLLWAVVLGAVEGEGASVVAKKTFSGSDLLVTVVWQIPNAVFVLNILWGVLLRGRRRLPAYATLVVASVAILATVCLIPSDPVWGGWIFATQLALVNFFVSGIVVLRASLWRANYPRTHRARISGRITTIRTLVTLLCVGALGMLFDLHSQLYRVVYAAVALVGLASLYPLMRMRVRGEKGERRRVRSQLAAARRGGGGRGVLGGLREMIGILRSDRVFATYMVGQFLIGTSNYFTGPLINMTVAGDLGFGYLMSAVLLVQLPAVMQLLAIRWWAPYYDRVGLLRYRVVNTLFWTGTMVVLCLAMLLLSQPALAVRHVGIGVLVIARLMHGVCTGGGTIAWNLGHLQYAPEHQTELYMAVHVMLTGVRGLVMPVLGFLAYQRLGWGAYLIALAIALAAHAVFRMVERLEIRLTNAAKSAVVEAAQVGCTTT